MYTHVLLDLDHTLLDTERSLRLAFTQAMNVAGVDASTDAAGHYATFDRINQALWREVEAQLRTPPQVHVARFEQLCEQLELDADPAHMAAAFAQGMGDHGDLYDGARAVLDALAPRVSMALVTNGLQEIQRARIDRLELDAYFDTITISGEVGEAKPGTAIFDVTFEALDNPDRTGAVMVGDSLSSDIAGGINAGIDTCWYNPGGKRAPLDGAMAPTHQISSLDQLIEICDR